MGKYPVKLMKFKKMILEHPELSPTEVANRTYNCKSRYVARVIASENLSKLNITFNELLTRAGLTDEEDAADLQRLRKATKPIACNVYVKQGEDGKYEMSEADGMTKDFIDVDDNQTQLKALELTMKLKGRLKEQRTEEGSGMVETILVELIRKADQELTDVKGLRIARCKTDALNRFMAK